MPVATYRPVQTPAVSVPRKTTTDQPLPLYTRQAPVQVRHSTSPGSVTSSVASSAVPSLTNGGGRSAKEYEYDSHHGVDLIDMMTDRLQLAVNPEPLDRTIVKQAQTSGELNAKQRELAELQAMAQRRLKSTRANISDGLRAAREVRRDLDWTQKKVTTLTARAQAKHPQAYKLASAKYPRPISP